MLPEIAVFGDGMSGVVIGWHTRNLYQTGFDGVDESEVGYDPIEWRPGTFPKDAGVHGRGGEVDCAYDSPVSLDAFKAIDPDGCLAQFLRVSIRWGEVWGESGKRDAPHH